MNRAPPVPELVPSDGLRCVWSRGAARGPFQVSQRQYPGIHRWSADGERLWTKAAGAEWTEWDASTGQRLRRARVPDNLAWPGLDPEQVARLLPLRQGGRPERKLLAKSRDLRRAVTASYPDGKSGDLRDVADASLVASLDAAMPFAFSPDGTRLVGRAWSPSGLCVFRADDGELLTSLPLSDPAIGELATFVWAPGGELLIAAALPGRRQDKLICYHVDHQKLLWEEPGAFRRIEVSADGSRAAGLTLDGGVRVWEIATGRVLRAVAQAELPKGPLVCGEPDTLSLLDRLATHPVVFEQLSPVRSIRAFAAGSKAVVDERIIRTDTGEELANERVPWAGPDDARCAEAAAATWGQPSASVRAVSDDGALVLFLLSRNDEWIPDPDAGSVYRSDVSVGMWNDRAGKWLWETDASPAEFTLGYLRDQGSFAFSWNQRGVFVRAAGTLSTTLYDTLTGRVRAVEPGDHPPAPACVAVHPSGVWAIGFRGSVVELRDIAADSVLGTIDLAPMDDEPSAASFLGDARSFLLGTEHGRLMRIDF